MTSGLNRPGRHRVVPAVWTVEAVLEHLSALLWELNVQVQQRLVGMDQALDLARELHEAEHRVGAIVVDGLLARVTSLENELGEIRGRRRGLPWLMAGAGLGVAALTLIIDLFNK